MTVKGKSRSRHLEQSRYLTNEFATHQNTLGAVPVPFSSLPLFREEVSHIIL